MYTGTRGRDLKHEASAATVLPSLLWAGFASRGPILRSDMQLSSTFPLNFKFALAAIISVPSHGETVSPNACARVWGKALQMDLKQILMEGFKFRM